MSSFLPPTLFGDEVTSSGTSETVITYTDPIGVGANAPVTLYITLNSSNSGTIQFSKGSSVGASARAFAAGEKVPFTVRSTTSSGSVVVQLRYKASATNQKFTVTQ
jgi:hypothetical protein